MVPSSSIVISAPVSSWMELIIFPLGPITSPILSTGTLMVMIRGAYGLISPGESMASRITSRMVSRAALAWVSAAASTDAGMPSSLVSSWSAVITSRVPATLKSMSPNASSAPRMSVSVTYWPPSWIRPMAIPATMSRSGTPASSSAIVEAHTDRLGDLPDRVGELLPGGQHRDHRALGQGTVADLPPLGRAHPAGLAGGVRRHVVVVHVPLGALGVERVDRLLHPQHVQRGHAE